MLRKLSVEMQSETSQTSNTSGRKTLLVLMVVFLLPFILAATLHLVGWKASGRSYGDLLQPPRSLQLRDLQDAQGKPFGVQRWKKKWTMVMVVDACEATCRTQLQKLQNLRVSLGKDAGRVQQVLLMPAGKAAVPQSDIVVLTGADAADFALQFKLAGQSAIPPERLYLVDPLGNLMMSYAPGYEPRGLRDDVLHLLKNSWAG
jgi:hypothetical protein